MHIRRATVIETRYILDHSLQVMKEATLEKIKPLKHVAQQVMEPVLLPDGYYLVCEKEGQIYGWIGIGETYDYYTDEHIGMIPELYVLPPFRRQGVASELCNEACERLKNEGLHKVQLNVFAGNEAKKLYEKMGFYDVSTLMEMRLT